MHPIRPVGLQPEAVCTIHNWLQWGVAAYVQAFADMLGLLGHENADIAADVLELFKELTEEDVVQDSVSSNRRPRCMSSSDRLCQSWCFA